MDAHYSLDEGLNAAKFGKYQGIVLVYAGLGWFSEAMEIMILSFVGPAVKSKWNVSSSRESMITTVVFAGMLIGAYSWGIISDKFGRRTAFLGISIVTSIAGILSAFSPNYAALIAIRFFVGIGLGGGPSFATWFLEFVPASKRGAWMVVFSLFWTFGTIFEASLAWAVMPTLGWRYLVGFSALPSIALFIFYFVIPESPRYLCTKGRMPEAQNILEKMARVNKAKLPAGTLVSDDAKVAADAIKVNEQSAPPKQILPISSAKSKCLGLKSAFASFFMLFSPKLLRTTFLLWWLYFGNSFSYYGIVLLTSKLSSDQNKCGSSALHTSNHNSLYMDVFITSFAEFPGLLISALIVDRIGRKFSIALMFVLACGFLLPLVFQPSAVVTTALLFGARMWVTGTFTVTCIYAPELYPTSARATGTGVASSVGRIGGMICPLVAVGLVSSCHLTEAIILFEAVIVISAICTMLVPIETKGRVLKDGIDSCGP